MSANCFSFWVTKASGELPSADPLAGASPLDPTGGLPSPRDPQIKLPGAGTVCGARLPWNQHGLMFIVN